MASQSFAPACTDTDDPRGPLDLALGAFEPIGLAEMDRGDLLDRVDTKYILPRSLLIESLAPVAGSYRILEIEGRRLHRYRSIYFDTPALDLYRAHHATRTNRYKVRSRRYLDSGIDFFEVKLRTKRDRTVKWRFPEAFSETIDGPARLFLDSVVQPVPAGLAPRLENTFLRATLAGIGRTERVTLDFDVAFTGNGRSASLPRLAVAEVKAPARSKSKGSDFAALMRGLGVRPVAFSKYCIGAALLHEDVKRNRFNRQIRLAERIGGGGRGCLLS